MIKMSKELKKHYAKITKKGGLAVKKKYGKKHFSDLGKKGGWPKGKKRKPEKVAKVTTKKKVGKISVKKKKVSTSDEK